MATLVPSRQLEQLPRGRPRRYAEMLDYEILKILSAQEGPVGSGTLQIRLRARGYDLSAPTAGRKLREFEVRGYLAKIGVRGRALTASGRRRLADLEHEVSLHTSSQALNRLIARGSKEEILQLLEARRIIEREIIRLAAARATPRDIEGLEEILRTQEQQVAQGGLAIAEDVRFHDTLAEIGGNRVLRSLLSVLRHQGQFTYIITYIRSRVSGHLVVDHLAIVEGVRAHDARRAQEAVDTHLRRLMRDVERYWRGTRAGPGRPRAPRPARRTRGA